MSQLATIIPESEMTAGDYKQNGTTYKELIKAFHLAQRSTEDFTELLLSAIEDRIWLGFINPSTGKFCSFIAHYADGTIDEATSFKLWLATGEKQGGLGITDIGDLASLCTADQECLEQLYPLLADNGSVRKANLLRGDTDTPIKKIAKSKQLFFNKIEQAPAVLKYFYFDLHLSKTFIMRAMINLEMVDAREYDAVLINLEHLKEDSGEMHREDLIDQISEIIGFTNPQKISLDFADPGMTAKKLYHSARNKESLRELINELQALLD